MWNLKDDTNKLISKTKIDPQIEKTNKYGYQRRKENRDKLRL